VKSKLLIILAAIFCATSCNTAGPMNAIAEVTYTSDAGTILPESQWHEQIVITKSKVSLTRNGRVAGTQVNAGSWEISVHVQEIAKLFEQLAPVDCATIKRVVSDDVPDGGGTESYTITYVRGKECSLVYDPGTTYTHSELLVKPLKLFIRSLALPADAAARYALPSP
jgi:hypothetical protein